MPGGLYSVKIKICGLSRPCDIDYVNEAGPDFAGFIVNVPKSRRNVSVRQLCSLRERLDDAIRPVGVFVDEPPETVAALLNDGVIALAQLHGQEDEAYIAKLRQLTDGKLIQAFSVKERADIGRAQKSGAELILLDHGAGGTGASFDWSLTEGIARPWFLAGGLTPENLPAAIAAAHPWGVDLSSGAETDGYKDREKILSAVSAARRAY